MSALSQAGKSSITNEINRAFTKGLVGVDPSQLERKQQQRKAYQQELRKQALQDQQRKAEQKRKLKEEDEKLQRKIEMDILKQKQQKQNAIKAKKTEQLNTNNANSNNTQINNTNLGSKNNNNDTFNQRKSNPYSQSTQNMIPKLSLGGQQMNLYKNIGLSLGNNFGSQSQQQPLFPMNTKNIYNFEEQNYYQQEMQNKARRFKQTLDRKLDEVYQQIQSSKKIQVGENVIDQIRRRLRSNSYLPQHHDFTQLQKSGIKQFQEQFSQFYRIPKKQNNFGTQLNNRTVRNLDYESQSKYSSRLRNYPQTSGTNYNSRVNTERVQKTQYDNEKQDGSWGLRGKKNFLGNRQALDFQLESKLTNIQDIISTQTKMYAD